jgi:release factor glutamine methyltransferase
MTMTLGTLLTEARQQLAVSSDSPRLDAEVLLGHVLQVTRAHLYANPDRPVDAAKTSAYRTLVDARLSGKPVAHLTGEREFWSLPLRVSSDVLVPRPETELLVEQCLNHLPETSDRSVLDLGCGSGAIAIAVATERSGCSLTATDSSAAALDLALANAARLCPGRIEFVAGDWFAPLAGRCFDIIASNPPYVATGQPELTDPELAFEPADALYSGPDGLDDIRLIINGASQHLNANGHLLLEHGFDQSASINALMRTAGFGDIATHADLAGQPRVTAGRWSA